MASKPKTTEWFIKKAKSIYGDKFDYSKSKYTFSSIPIEIICKIHGSFWQRSVDHFKGTGCPICNRRWTLQDFIKKSIKVHGKKYDYSLIKEESIIGQMILSITCKTHGPFQQKAKDHLRERGCNLCGRENMAKLRRLDKEKFLTRAKQIHGDLYDYSKVLYQNSAEKIEIICKTHGSFWQAPSNHLHKTLKQGCPKCAGNIQLTTEDFIKRAKEVHGDLYDYSKSIYLDSKSKVTINCKTHGSFYSIPSNHFKGQKCPKCKYRVSKPEIKWLDSLNIPKQYRQKYLTMNSGKRYEVDAFDPTTNTVYEFYGDYWHGNPNKFDPMEINERTKSTFGSLLKKTLDKELEIKENGYTVISIWEQDFLKSL